MSRTGRESFVRDLLIWFLVSVTLASLLSAGAGVLADRYFSQAVTGLIGEVGEYDLLFQVRNDLKHVVVSRLEEIITEEFPGSRLKTGVSVAGQSAVFFGLAPQYRTKEVFADLNSYFHDLPGGAGYSLMTEPRLTLSGIPHKAHDLFIREAERIPGVLFAFQDGSRVEVLFQKGHNINRSRRELERILADYRLLEVGIPTGMPVEDGAKPGADLVEILAGRSGVSYIRDVTAGSKTSDQEVLLGTMAEMKKFLFSYAGQVEVNPEPGCLLQHGDLLVLRGNAAGPLVEGETVKPENVLVKIISVEEKLKGVVIQGETAWIDETRARFVATGQKIGAPAANVIPDNPREQLLTALEEATAFFEQVRDFQDLSLQAEQVLTTADTIHAALETVDSVVSGPGGQSTARELEKLAHLFTGIGEELETMADTLARLRYFETRLQEAVEGLEGVQLLVRLGIIPQLPGAYGDLGRRINVLDQQMGQVVDGLRRHARSLDDFINRFNPLVQTLLAWRNKSQEISAGLESFQGLVEEDGGGLAELTTESLALFKDLDSSALRMDIDAFSQGTGGENVDFAVILEQMQVVQESLPSLRDEEIGRTLFLLDNYVGEEPASGEKVELFINAGCRETEVLRLVQEYFVSDTVEVQFLPAGVVRPDVRNELTQLLRDVKGVVTALVVFLLGLLTFLLDQAPVLAVLRHMELVLPLAAGSKKKTRGFLFYRLLPRLYAVVTGGGWFWAVYYFSRAHIPYFSNVHFLSAGALLGIGFFLAAEKFYRLNLEEITAGCSLGLSFTAVMREIVVPAGRPSLLQLLNRWKMVMK